MLDRPASIIICLTLVASPYLLLNRDVAVRAVDDTARLKFPTVVCHAFDCRLVLAGEGHIPQTAAIPKRRVLDARHARRDRHTCQAAAVSKRPTPDARHVRRDRHTCQIVAV